MAELATQEVKLFGKWSFDDVEVRFYFGNVVGGVVISQTRTTTVPRNGVMPKCFFFFSFFRGIVSRATRDGKGGVATREVRVADENRAATTFLNLNGVARRAVQRGPRRARRRCAPDTFGCFFSPGLFGLLFCPSNKTPFVVVLRVCLKER